MCVCDGCRCFPSLRSALLTFYIPSSLLILCCSAVIIYACCTSKRRSVMSHQRQPCLEQVDAKRRLLSVTSNSGPSSAEVDGVASTGTSGRTLTILTLLLVLGVLGWGCGAASVRLEHRTLGGTVVAGLYAVCTSTVALLLFVTHQPTLTSPTTSRRCWSMFCRGWRNCSDWQTVGSIVRENSPPAGAKQVVYSIANSAPPSFRVGSTPTVVDIDADVDYMTDFDEWEVAKDRRDCTGSSCSVPASLSAVQLPVSFNKCGECRLCRSATDSSVGSRCLSRNSTRMKDFDNLSWSSDIENHDDCAEGEWWNGEVDVDGCSIHRAPCPSPASACSAKNEQEARSSESSRTVEQRPVVVLQWTGQRPCVRLVCPRWWCSESSPSRCSSTAADSRHVRRWSVVGASPATSRRTPRRGKHEETGPIRRKRRRKTNRSLSRGTMSIGGRCLPGWVT